MSMTNASIVYPFAHEIELRPGMVVMAHRDRIERFAGQPRIYFDPMKVREKGLSMKVHGQESSLITLIVQNNPDYRLGLIDGECRWQGSFLEEVNIEWLRCEVRGFIEDIDDDERFESSAIANFCRDGHTPMEHARMVLRMSSRLVDGKSRPRKMIAQMFGKSVGWVDQHLSLNNLHPDVQHLLEPSTPEDKRLTLSNAILLTTLDHTAQSFLATRIVGKRQFAARHDIMKYLESVQGHATKAAAERGPKDNYDIMRNLIRDIDERSGILLDIKSATLVRMLEGRKVWECEYLLEAGKRAQDNLNELLEAIGNAKDVVDKREAESRAQQHTQ
ncbi:MAG: hypothetical protein AAB400_01525 [Patescibacteria group bacterium]